jgi:hypothetical protein
VLARRMGGTRRVLMREGIMNRKGNGNGAESEGWDRGLLTFCMFVCVVFLLSFSSSAELIFCAVWLGLWGLV